MILTDAELELYVPPPCLRCGATPEVDWCEITSFADLGQGHRMFAPGDSRCPTAGCADERGRKAVSLERCRTCRREPGDVHGPDCGPLMATKILCPHIVTVEDCR